ncbi:GNAT family N-acetyltransferase [Saccharospirillum mangrovi]|uniref:GNAT family N-acetyltransferase n=1 Tax=Saccharospirillum mangrovi TaxID=2161747 RepID=UPI000D3877A5|nr:GNAT family N-acetyltransferase [Saccharospirillum mangrovi]
MSEITLASGARLRFATAADVPAILGFICELADYEHLRHEVVATEASLAATLFGERAYAEVIIAELNGTPVGMALFFHNYSTFLAQPGIHLEDLYVQPQHRGLSLGKALITRVAQIAVERNCGRLEWQVLDWNEPARHFYRQLGAEALDDWLTKRVTGDTLKDMAQLFETCL